MQLDLNWTENRKSCLCRQYGLYGIASLFKLLCLGLLLLLLLLATLGCLLRSGLGRRFGRSLFLLLLLFGFAAASDEETDHTLGCNEAVIVDLKLAKDVVDLGLGELVSPRLEGVREHLSVDLPCLLSLALVGSECPDDQVVGVVGAAGHLLLEHLDHAVEGARTANLRQHVVEFALVHELADVVEGGAQVGLVDGAVLVHVHELETLLVHVDLVLGEPAIVALSHLGLVSCIPLRKCETTPM